MQKAAGSSGSESGDATASVGALAGRQDALAYVRRAVEEAIAGRGQLVLLTGEAGIGKTAMAAEAAAYAAGRGALVAWGSCWQGEGAPGYWPWVQVLRSLAPADGRLRRRLAAEAPALARLLSEIPEPAAAPQPATTPEPAASAEPAAAPEPATFDEAAAVRFQLFDELASTLLASSKDRPLAVVLDDLHWADAPSLLLLEFLARRLHTARVLVVATYRDVDVGPHDPLAPLLAEVAAASTVLPLRALAEAEVAEVMATITGAEPAAHLAASVHRRTGGNPFFVHQLTRLLMAQAGSAERLRPAAAGAIPPGVRATIERRLARLSPRCTALLGVAAVVGPELSAALLARVTGQPPAALRELLDEAVRARVLAGPREPPGPYRFAHDLFRETVDAELGADARARLHLQVGEALEADRMAGGEASPASLANHFVLAAAGGAGGEEQAVRYSTLAAIQATRRLAHEEAARHWERALEILDPVAGVEPSRRIALLVELGDARRRAGDLPAGRHAYVRAAQLARQAADPAGLARAALGLHAIGSRSWPSLADEVLLVLEEAAAALGGEDTPMRARVLASLARELAWNGLDLARASRLAEQAVAAARRAADPAVLASCLLAQHNVVWGPGNAADRLALAGQLVEQAERMGDLELLAEARLLRAGDLLELADPRFHAELDEFIRIAETLRQPRLRYAALCRRALRALMAGRFGQAERLIGEAAALGRDLGEPDASDVEYSQLWELRSGQGRRSELLEGLRRLFPDESVQGRWFLAMSLLEQGDRHGAEAAAAPLLELDGAAPPRDQNWLPGVAYAGELAALLGTHALCERLHDALAPHAGEAVVVGAAITFRGASPTTSGCWRTP